MKGYEALEKQQEGVYRETGRLFSKECGLLEEAISFSFASYFALNKSKLDEKQEQLAALFYRNCVYVSAAYRMIRMGMPDPAGNNMRTVFETIIWQYAYLVDDGIYDNFREMTALETEKMNSLPRKQWSNTKERKLENLRRKYSFQKTMKQLYSKELYEKFFSSQYWILCHKSHSSLFGVNYNTPTMEGKTTIDKNPEELKNNLMGLLYLCAENLLCFLNCFSGILQQESIDSVVKFSNKVNSSISPALSLVPDTKEMPFTTRLRKL